MPNDINRDAFVTNASMFMEQCCRVSNAVIFKRLASELDDDPAHVRSFTEVVYSDVKACILAAITVTIAAYSNSAHDKPCLRSSIAACEIK